MIVAFIGQKGGVGKTTLALHVASEFARAGERVTLIDADPQGSALDWALARARAERHRRFAVIGLAHETLHLEVPDVARSNDHVVIDAASRSPGITRSAITASDVVVIPVQPSPFDLWAGRELIDWVWQAQLLKPRLTATFVANRVVVGSIVGRALSEALSRTGVRQLTTEVSQRVIFAECSSSGRVVGELEAGGRAALEISDLVEELRSLPV